MNNYYELTYIVTPVLEDEEYKEVVNKVNDTIEQFRGEIEEVDEWGIRKFTYEMDKKSSGYYVNLYFEAPSSRIEQIERQLRINDQIMRFLVLKYDAKMLRHRELQKKNAVPSVFEQKTEEE